MGLTLIAARRVGASSGRQRGGPPTRFSPSPPRWWPTSVYYGWALVLVLGTTALLSYGLLLYALSVFAVPMRESLQWSAAEVTAGISLAQLVAGLAAIPVGRWVDRHGARALMSCGALLAALLLAAWSRVATPLHWYLLMIPMGLAMAAVQYEPAFAVIATWFRRGRARALTLITFMGAFASLVGVPLAAALVQANGWRSALLQLSVIYAAATVLPLAIVLRRHPRDVGSAPDGDDGQDTRSPSTARDADERRGDATPHNDATAERHPPHDERSAQRVRRSAPYRWIAFSMTIANFVGMAVVVHLIPILLERGISTGQATAAMAAFGITAIPGRLLLVPLESHWSARRVAAALLALQAAATAWFLLGNGLVPVWGFVVLFGACAGAMTPTRASLVAELAPAHTFGRVNGPIVLLIAVARATAPLGGSLLMSLAPAGERSAVLMATLATLSAVAAAAVLASGTAPRVLATGSPIRHP